jgi:ABC-type phosphate transport system substrate-binding protein
MSMKLIALILLFLPTTPALAGLVVVTNPRNGVTSMSADEVRKVFLGKNKYLPGGVAANPVDQPEKSGAFRAFYEVLLKMSPREIRAFWAGKIFSGKGAPPQSLASDAEVRDFVARNNGGIGYIAQESVNSSVRVLLRVE